MRMSRLPCRGFVLLALSPPAWSQSGRTIRIDRAGAGRAPRTDFAARLMAEHIGKTQGVTVVVENRPARAA